MKKAKKIQTFSFAKFQAVLFGLIGLICGILYSFGGFAIDTLVSFNLLSNESMSTPGLSYGTVLAFGALIGMPLLFLITGFITGIIEAILFNLFAKWFRGFSLNFEQKNPE